MVGGEPGDEKTTQHTMDNGHNKPTKRKNSDEEDYDSDQAYLERYKKTREEILEAKIFFPRFLMMTSGDDEKSLSRLSTFAQLAQVPVKVSPHRTLNTSKGVLRTPELENTTREELLTQLKNKESLMHEWLPLKKTVKCHSNFQPANSTGHLKGWI